MGYQPGTYILGPSHSLSIVPNANPIGLPSPIILDGDRTEFTAKEEDELTKNDTIDNGGRVVGTRVPGGVSGSIKVDKSGQDFSQLMMALDLLYYGGGPKVDFTMTETITLADGTLEQNQYLGLVFHGYDKGAWQRKDIPIASVNFFATEIQAL